MKKERLEQIGREYQEARNNKEAMESFIAKFTAEELAEIRVYVVENLADSTTLEVLANAGYTKESYIEEQSKAIEVAKEELSVKDIIDYQMHLEMSGCRTIDGFMTSYFKYEWDQDPFYIAISEILKQTMYFDSVIGCWMDKDIC